MTSVYLLQVQCSCGCVHVSSADTSWRRQTTMPYDRLPASESHRVKVHPSARVTTCRCLAACHRVTSSRCRRIRYRVTSSPFPRICHRVTMHQCLRICLRVRSFPCICHRVISSRRLPVCHQPGHVAPVSSIVHLPATEPRLPHLRVT